ncbi:MAG: tetratricopeptide repeat protein [Burkholderiales bacterium]
MSTTSTALRELTAADWAQFERAQSLHLEGHLEEARQQYTQLLHRHPQHPHLLHSMGLAEVQAGQFEAGLPWLQAAVQATPTQVDFRINLARALQHLGRVSLAIEQFEQAIALRPSDLECRLDAAVLMVDAGQLARARTVLASLLVTPAAAGTTAQQARAHLMVGEADRALALLDEAVRRAPGTEALERLRARALLAVGRIDDALAEQVRLAGPEPRSLTATRDLGAALLAAGRLQEVLELLESATNLHPDASDLWNSLGGVQAAMRRREDALLSFQRAVQNDPNSLSALQNFADALLSASRAEDAAVVYERLLSLWPDAPHALGRLVHAKMLMCDWLRLDDLNARVNRGIESGQPVADPFAIQGHCTDPRLLRLAAERAVVNLERSASAEASTQVPVRRIRGARDRLRIGYVSGEFRQQATSILLTRLLELHDPQRFEVIAFDNGHDDGSPLRRRIEAAVAELVPISFDDTATAARKISERGIDILVNLNGYFGLDRSDVFARRPAPVQVSFLGWPGTTGAPWMDYLIADQTVIPPSDQVHYTEAVVYLPDCYQVNDDMRQISDERLSRADVGLPQAAFVFCSFNSTYKIVPEVFAVWMRLLNRVPKSVLWLLVPDEAARFHLNASAQAQGVDPARLVFADFWPNDRHLARLRLADLFLDTWPYNAHTTGSDALWAGLPVLTCTGPTFPSRVGASMLQAVGLPELITHTLDDYEAEAVRLATHPDALSSIRARLNADRATQALFDTPRYRTHIEAAFEHMVERARNGLAPAAFSVEPFAAVAP